MIQGLDDAIQSHHALALSGAAPYIARSMDDVRLKKIKFRAWHRGFREADLILGAFADARLDALDATELDQFESLLEQADHDIYNWITGRDPTPPEFDTKIMNKIKEFRYQYNTLTDQPRGA